MRLSTQSRIRHRQRQTLNALSVQPRGSGTGMLGTQPVPLARRLELGSMLSRGAVRRFPLGARFPVG